MKDDRQYKDINLTEILGEKVPDDNNSLTVGESGYMLLADTHTVQKLSHFNRERIPERVVHAKGSGAYGYFEVTNDLSRYTCADLYQGVGKRTEVFARFSTVGGEKGSADSARDPRGFAVKHYTKDGNFDVVGNNTPVFFIRDPIKFPDFIHTQKRNPQTGLKDANMVWDFFSLTPESIHQVTILYSDRGTPLSFRYMNGFGTNTLMWYNEKKEYFWVKYHFLTDQGIRNLTDSQSVELAGTDPDYSIRDLFDAIEQGQYPSWSVYVQIMRPEDAKTYRFYPFDTTLVWFHADYPLIPLGKMVLNKNPENFFAEVEQAAFSPGNMVTGVSFSPDRMLQGRMFAYTDAQRYRLGANAHLIPVNVPKNAEVKNYQRDGFMMTGTNGGMGPNYFPNSTDCTYTDPRYAPPKVEACGDIAHNPFKTVETTFFQAGELYSRVMDDSQRDNLIYNITVSLSQAHYLLQYRQCALFYKANEQYGQRVAKSLGLDMATVIKLAAMDDAQRAKATQHKNCKRG